MQDLDTEIVIATAREGSSGSTAVAANILVDERQMNKLFLDVVSVTIKYIISPYLFNPNDTIFHMFDSSKLANLTG